MAQFEFTKEMVEDAIDCVYDYLANADSPCEEGKINVEDEFTLKDGKIVWIDFDYWTEDYDYRPERYNERLGIWEQEECSGKYVAKINLISYYNDDDDNEYVLECNDLFNKKIKYEWY